MRTTIARLKGGLRIGSMRARMTVLFASFVALLLFTAGMAEWTQEKSHVEGHVQEILSVAKARAQYELSEDEAGTGTVLGIARQDQGEISAGGLVLLVVDAKNRVLWRSRQATPPWPLVGRDWRVETLSYRGQTLVLARYWQPTQRELDHLTRTLWRLGILMVLIAGVGAWFMVGRTLLPIEKLAIQASNVSSDSLSVRLRSPSSDAEMRRLTQTLNGLLANIEHESRLRGRFYAAASHELRTPIQGLMGQLDVASSRSRSVPEYEAIIEKLKGSAERLSSLAEDLLQLNALEMGQRQAQTESLNLAFWVERAIDQQEPNIRARGLRVETELKDVFVQAPAFHIEMLLRNLVENAAKYAVADTLLLVRLDSDAKGAELRIENTANVPEGTDLEQWFEPFFRMDILRTSPTGGNGLGLTIVAALAKSNGWRVELSHQGDRVTQRVQFLKSHPRDNKPCKG